MLFCLSGGTYPSQALQEDLCYFTKLLTVDVDMAFKKKKEEAYNINLCAEKISLEKTECR